jgi:hypothetical protein
MEPDVAPSCRELDPRWPSLARAAIHFMRNPLRNGVFQYSRHLSAGNSGQACRICACAIENVHRSDVRNHPAPEDPGPITAARLQVKSASLWGQSPSLRILVTAARASATTKSNGHHAILRVTISPFQGVQSAPRLFVKHSGVYANR